MTKWLWYGSGATVGLAVLTLVIGLCLIPQYPLGAKGQSSQDGSSVSGQVEGLAESADGDIDSSLVSAARLFSKRMVPPKPKPKVEPKSPKPIIVEKIEKPELPPPPPPPKMGTVRVIIIPQDVVPNGARWRIGGGSWQETGSTLNKVEVGARTIQLKSVKGWVTPDNIMVKVSEDKTTDTTVKYTIVKPPGPNFTLTGTLVIGPENGLAWFKLPKESKYKAFFVGETIDKYKLASVNNGSVVLIRQGFEYSLDVPKPTQKEAAKKSQTKPKKETKRRPPKRRRDR